MLVKPVTKYGEKKTELNNNNNRKGLYLIVKNQNP
jgi:hypothetical protein